MRNSVLLTTMGAVWQIPPELYGFTNPKDLDLYRNHSCAKRIEQCRRDYGIEPVREIWVITTGGDPTAGAVKDLIRWHAAMAAVRRPVLRIWRVRGINDLATEEECGRMKEAIFRIAMHAAHAAGEVGPLFSLTGGRKTMSSDLQEAAGWFGCRSLVHVIDNTKFSTAMRDLKPEDFTRPLPADLDGAATPLVSSGRFERNALLDLDAEGDGPLTADRWPIGFAQDGVPLELDIPEPFLFQELERRRKKAGYHYAQYATSLIHGNDTANFMALYSLPPGIVKQLKTTRIGVDPAKREKELAWLKKLPKADLHCHLGGIADCREMIEIAAASRSQIEKFRDRLDPFLSDWKQRLENESAEEIRAGFDAKALRGAVPGVPEPLCVSAFLLLFEDRPDLLDQIVYGPFCDEGSFCGIGFSAYEKLGDLQGSGLLQNEENIRAACLVLLEKASENNVKYLEVRCSPAKYIRGGLSSKRVAEAIAEALNRDASVQTSIIFTASRHGRIEEVMEHVNLAKTLLDLREKFPLRGFDLAGDEKARAAACMRDALMPMMQECLHFTIHAGENVPVESIWEAVYHLNAERIGHGLTLKENSALLEKFRDRGIALEMCPSSNFQIAGFKDNLLPNTYGERIYPLRDYLEAGLRVTVNTDNPGISRTDPAKELHRAARLTPEGLSCWEICGIIRNGFKNAFAERDVRTSLIRVAEKELIVLFINPSTFEFLNDSARP